MRARGSRRHVDGSVTYVNVLSRQESLQSWWPALYSLLGLLAGIACSHIKVLAGCLVVQDRCTFDEVMLDREIAHEKVGSIFLQYSREDRKCDFGADRTKDAVLGGVFGR